MFDSPVKYALGVGVPLMLSGDDGPLGLLVSRITRIDGQSLHLKKKWNHQESLRSILIEDEHKHDDFEMTLAHISFGKISSNRSLTRNSV